jgi:hypothetical protein
LPQVIYERQIQNRLGGNEFQLRNLKTSDVVEYLRHLVDSFIDRDKVEVLVANGEINAADYTWDSYPFTPNAKARFIDYFDRTQADAKPRDISKKLDLLAIHAGKKPSRLIDEQCLTDRGM